jgi:hypothetical protein
MISLVRFNQKAGQGLFLSTFACGRGKRRNEMPFHFIISFADAYSYFQLGIVTTRVSKKEKGIFSGLRNYLAPHLHVGICRYSSKVFSALLALVLAWSTRTSILPMLTLQ